MKQVYFLIFGTACLLHGEMFAQSDAMKSFFKGNENYRKQAIEKFPFQNYLEKVALADLKTIQLDRLYFQRRSKSGDLFLYYLAEAAVEGKTLALTDYSELLETGKLYIQAKAPGIRNKTPYGMVGYFLLGKVARSIEENLKSGQLNENSPYANEWISTLREHKIYVSLEKETIQKVTQAIQSNDFDYLANRAVQKTVPYSKMLDMFLYRYFAEAFPFFWWYEMKEGEVGESDFGEVSSSLSLPMGGRQLYPGGANFRLRLQPIFHDVRGEVGASVWLSRPFAKASYFTRKPTNAVFLKEKVKKARAKGNLLAVTTGGFTNNYSLPEGLTVEEGEIVNALLLHDRHGLVLVQPSGGMRVINLKRSEIYLPRKNREMLAIRNPLKSLVAYSQLIDWCKQNRVTMFQTQLLAFGDELLINPEKASKEVAERRLLALVSSGKKIEHVIFHFEKDFPLAEAGSETFNLLKLRGKKVEAILNLDTGGQDVFRVYDPQMQEFDRPKGKKPIEKTTNLLIYRY